MCQLGRHLIKDLSISHCSSLDVCSVYITVYCNVHLRFLFIGTKQELIAQNITPLFDF